MVESSSGDIWIRCAMCVVWRMPTTRSIQAQGYVGWLRFLRACNAWSLRVLNWRAFYSECVFVVPRRALIIIKKKTRELWINTHSFHKLQCSTSGRLRYVVSHYITLILNVIKHMQVVYTSNPQNFASYPKAGLKLRL